jgi:hypothetical protein
MSEQTEPIEPGSAPPPEATPTTPVAPVAVTPAPVAPAPTPMVRRSVTVPLLPLAIVGGIIVALLFFGGGVAIGYGVASHDGRPGNMQQYRGGDRGDGFGQRNGFAPGQGQPNQNSRPGDRPTAAPNNG